MAKDLESEIRRALDNKAHEVDVPVDLASRTLVAAREGAQPSLRDRLRALTDARRSRASVTGYPLWAYAGAAAAAAVLLFTVGTIVRPGPVVVDMPVAEPGVVTADPAVGRAFDTQSSGLAQDEEGAAEGAGRSGAEPAPDTMIAPIPPVPGRPGQFPPKIVRTANISIEVASFERAWSRANAVAARHRGFVTFSESGLERGSVTMRIPADRLDAALDDLRELGKVDQASTTAEDVSAQIVDVEARIRVLEAEELQLLELLRRATGVGQTLEVRDRLNTVRQEIESLRAQREYFTNQVDYSTITATIYERGASEPRDPGDDGILLNAWRTALRVGLTIVAGSVVVAGGLLPLVALGLAAWAGVRLWRRRSA